MSAVVSAKITKSFVADKSKPKSRGSRGGAKRRMRIAQSQNMSKRSAVPPPYLSAANAEPCLGPSMMGYRAMGLTAPIRAQKFGFFDTAVSPKKRVEAALKPPRFNEAPIDEAGGRASFIAPPTLGPSTIVPPVIKPPTSNLQPRVAHMEAARPTEADILAVNSTTGMNEIFAKMVWKKLNMIKDPVRLARMHTCVMGILQQAITEEATGCSGPPKKS